MSRTRFLLAVALGALLAGVVGLAAGLPLALAHRDELPLERAYGAFAVGVVSWALGGDAANPRANDARAIAAGRNAFTGSCAICHGANGDGRGRLGASTYPNAADLRAANVRAKTDAQLFWIVKNGLAFTAMPSFGDQYNDDQIWALVSFIRELQRGGAGALSVREPTEAERALADPRGDRAARGAAIFFAQGCHLCHGPDGEAPGDLSIRGRVGTDVVRKGDPAGMPAFAEDRISASELADLEAFLLRFAGVPFSAD